MVVVSVVVVVPAFVFGAYAPGILPVTTLITRRRNRRPNYVLEETKATTASYNGTRNACARDQGAAANSTALNNSLAVGGAGRVRRAISAGRNAVSVRKRKVRSGTSKYMRCARR